MKLSFLLELGTACVITMGLSSCGTMQAVQDLETRIGVIEDRVASVQAQLDSLKSMQSSSNELLADNTWRELRLQHCGCSILMPGIPSRTDLSLNSAMGLLDTQVWKVDTLGFEFAVICAVFPRSIQNSDVEELLDAGRDHAVESARGGRLLWELLISKDNYPGREWLISSPDNNSTVHMRVYIVKEQSIQLLVTSSNPKSFSKNVEKFFESFELLHE